MPDPIAVLVHVSDLHIGELDPVTGNARLSKLAATLVKNTPAFDGLLGHQARSLRDLAAYVKTEKKSNPALRVVVTGDYTRSGAAAELDLAREYCVGSIDLLPPHGVKAGLELGEVPVGVFGNHDHWGGVCFPVSHARSAASGSTIFPYVAPPVSLAGGYRLVFCGIDSDADVAPTSLKRLFARGAFQTQLAALAGQLQQCPPEEIRVLLVHHSSLYGGYMLGVDPGSKQQLQLFVAAHGIKAVLTGHTHQDKGPIGSHVGAQCHEYCCGTTTQLDHVPYEWSKLMGGAPRRPWPQNTLMVHRIHDSPGGLTWEAEVLHRTIGSGFQNVNQAKTFCRI